MLGRGIIAEAAVNSEAVRVLTVGTTLIICRAIALVTIPTEAIIIIPAARRQAKQRLLQMAIIQTQQNQVQIKQRRLRLRRLKQRLLLKPLQPKLLLNNNLTF